jgi:hypothetical protein
MGASASAVRRMSSQRKVSTSGGGAAAGHARKVSRIDPFAAGSPVFTPEEGVLPADVEMMNGLVSAPSFSSRSLYAMCNLSPRRARLTRGAAGRDVHYSTKSGSSGRTSAAVRTLTKSATNHVAQAAGAVGRHRRIINVHFIPERFQPPNTAVQSHHSRSGVCDSFPCDSFACAMGFTSRNAYPLTTQLRVRFHAAHRCPEQMIHKAGCSQVRGEVVVKEHSENRCQLVCRSP